MIDEEKELRKMRKEETEIEIRFSDLLTIFKRSWFLMVMVGVIVFGAAFTYFRFFKTELYTASFSMYLLPKNIGKDASENANTQLAYQVANALINDSEKLVKNREKILYPVLEEAAPFLEEKGCVMTAESFEKCIDFKTNEDDTRVSRVVKITVTTSDSELSILLSKLLQRRLLTYYNNPDSIFGYDELLSVFDDVDEEAAKQVSNNTSTAMIVLIAFAAAIGVYAVAFVAFLWDDRINNEEDVERYLHLNLLGTIPNRRDSHHGNHYGYYAYYSARK